MISILLIKICSQLKQFTYQKLVQVIQKIKGDL